jgi:NAD(P)-dependent dehydrogenase (short-subunit alcohol dehydrogenase family)
MESRFKGKIAIVTGAGSGVGKATLERLCLEGARVAAIDVDGARLTELEKTYPDGQVLGVDADVSHPEDCERYVRTTVQKLGKINLFVNNAGVMEKLQRPLFETSVEEFDRVFAVNTRGVFLGLREVMKEMVAQKSGGAIVNVASIAALRARADAGVYGASKRAVVGLSNSAALEGGPHGIRVNCICPGPVQTGMTGTAGTANSPSLAAQYAARAQPRRAPPEEIANFICYLLSDEASYQAAGVYTIDGGTIV